ncbi:polyketide synthase [Variovorax sp. OV329]|uniref:polyketide synthase n=1 Tax=Variovorax sp. OV329 TaxID=1882825 RepID=UPI0020C91A36|nr:polyketide synthase [Variovorax sp. OV329]
MKPSPDDFGGFVPIHWRIARQAGAQPQALAVSCEGASISYAELERRSNALAARLQAMGAGRDQLVAVGLERSIDMVVALLAVLKSGAAYLPIDLAYPQSRLEFVLQDAQPVAFVTSSSAQAQLPAGTLPLLLVDEPLPDAVPAQVPAQVPADPQALAYVIYTSGSTGTPKGCLVTHGNVARLFDATAAWYGFDEKDVWTFFHSHAFDFSVWEIWGALVYGGRVVVVPQALTRSPAEFLDLLVREGVTVLNQTPSAFRTLIDADARGTHAAEAISLRHVIFGGEALELQMLRPWFDRHGDTQPRLVNMYGITETTVHVSYRPIHAADLAAGRGSVIGEPIPDLRIDLVDDNLAPVPAGEAGEILVSGAGVSKGYLRRPELSAQRFIDWRDPATGQVLRAYRSGDLARRTPEGDLEYMGRIDQQVKIRGFRIETGEIESQLLQHAGVRGCAVVARQDEPGGEPRLVAYVVPEAGQAMSAPDLRAHLGERIPAYMVPAAFVQVESLPMTENGKLDRKALPAPPRQRPELVQAFEEARSESEARVCAAFARALNLDEVGRADNFFELGGDSLRVHRVLAELQATYPDAKLSANLFFRQPTAAALAKALDEALAAQSQKVHAAQQPAPIADAAHEPIALIAMAGRFPGANSVEQFWDNLLAGRDSITVFDDSTLDAGVSAALRADPDYVKARGIIEGVENFDAAFFGINPKEAELMDPQQRLFMEICWECLERGGYAPDRTTVPVGVYGGMNNATYFQKHLSTRPDLVEAVGEFQVMLANEKDFIATRVAHRINLTGPAVSIHTACSTSLVAVHSAFQALRAGECSMALAGGVAIACPPRSGYLYQEGAMLSPDGHTRSFDAKAQGTVFSDGAAVVLLKRLSDALADGDPIYAVLRGTAINNDGGAKASFTAPSVDGQAKVIGAALANAGVDARSIAYVETHGTATPMGDPVEIEALTQAYRRHTQDTGFCEIGSVKSNVGHLIMAAGATGLIKTALSLHSEQLPASLHFESPNPAIDFDATPFRVHSRLARWPRNPQQPRRAGVSSFGVGGTNAHAIVEEAPLRAPSDASEGPQLLQLSARTPTALAAACERLADHLQANPALSLVDVAHTLRVGRTPFAQRAVVVAETAEQAVQALRSSDSPARAAGATGARMPQPVFMFPGQGAQYAGMGKTLYASGRAHRAAFDDCLQGFEGLLPFDLRERMFSPDPSALAPTSVTQPATFTLEYVLATHLLSLGVQPAALVGHSVGEFVAAVLAGVMSLKDAARLVARRGALMQALPAGTMLSVRLAAKDLLARLPATLSLAAENGPTACVAAGPSDEIEKMRAALEADGVVAKVLQTSHAFHSAMMEPAVPPFEALVREIELKAPQRPIYSTLTGKLLIAQEATDPHYWARHLRETVRFSPAVREVMAQLANPLFIELGPRNTLAMLVRQHSPKAAAVSFLADKPEEEERAWRLATGRLWTLGAEVDLSSLDTRASKRRLCLPTYPFERKRLWVDIATPAPALPVSPTAAASMPAATAVASVAMPATPTPAAPALPEPSMTAATTDRRPALAQRLRTLFEDISGIDLAEAESGAPFVEMGLDSLTLTQAALQVKKSFKVNLTFRQLMENYRSFDALSAFLDSTLPPEPVAAAPVVAAQPAPVAVAAMPAPVQVMAPVQMAAVPMALPAGDGSLVQQVIAQQMQLMQQQLALLSGAAAPMPVAVPQQQPAVAVAAPAAPAALLAPATPAATAPAADADATAPMKYDVKKAFGAIARIHTQGNKEMTERQKARLSAFVRRYVERTKKSKEFTAANRPHMADPRVVNGFRPTTKEIVYQIVVERSKGSRLWDLDGNEYVDVLNGFGMNLFGWQPDFVQEAVRKQLDLGYEIGPQHPLAAEVSQLICELTGFDRAALCNTGSESVMAAIRIARTVTGRNTVVLFTGSYHGTFDEVLVRAGRNAKGMPAAPGIMNGMFGDVRVLDYGTPESLEFIRDNADDLAAVLVESVQSRRPDFQPREFLREVRDITERAGSCLIFDEVITGFRAHLRGAQAIFGIKADLACYGKVIGGGFPVGVIAGKRDYMDSLDGGGWQYGDDSVPTVGVTYFAGTFVRHPLALAACKASLLHLKEAGEALQTQLNLHTAAMADELSAFCREVGAPIEIRYFASLWRVSWLEDHPLQDLLFAMMRSRGVHILDNFPCFMTTAHTQQDIAKIKSAFKESVAEMQEAEFLPRNSKPSMAMDASRPPVPNARLGRDKDGQPAWFIPDPAAPGKFKRVEA